MSFNARYSGTCSVCDERFEVGDRIQSDAHDGYAHVACPEAPKAEVCTMCFLERPCPCDDGQ